MSESRPQPLPYAQSNSRWNANSEQWVRQVRGGHDLYRHAFLEPAFMDFLGPIQNLKGLDAACGEGTSTRIMARAGARMSAVDLSDGMIHGARTLEATQPLGIQYHHASVDQLPFQAGEFDLVASWMALSDVPCYADAMREFLRVLRPGGRLCFCIRHPAYFTSRMGLVRDERGGPPSLRVGNYFLEHPWMEKWAFAGGQDEARGAATFQNIRFPFTLTDCLNGVLGAGFRLERICEPRPTDAMCAQHPRLRFWRTQVALYLFVDAYKPG